MYSDTSRSITGGSIFLKDALVIYTSQRQKYYALSMTKLLLIIAVIVIQHMLYIINLLHAFKLKVELLMIIKIDNKRYINLINN